MSPKYWADRILTLAASLSALSNVHAKPVLRRAPGVAGSGQPVDFVPLSPTVLTTNDGPIPTSASTARASDSTFELVPPRPSATIVPMSSSAAVYSHTIDSTPVDFVPPAPSGVTAAISTTHTTSLAPAGSTGNPLGWLPPTPSDATVFSPDSTSSSSTSAPSSPTSSLLPPTPSASWYTPWDMDNLDVFNVTKFSSGEDNLWLAEAEEIPLSFRAEAPPEIDLLSPILSSAIIKLDPDASRATVADMGEEELGAFNRTTLEVWYPKGSIDPGNDDAPDGGSQFYASPVDLSSATNVTLAYSVFFPLGFNWVKGGKLPGLYGGHTGCSGGNSATSCFSTRLMWRQDGAGELYLYAPKYSQGPEVCKTPPLSVCDAEWGLSVGRGSFNYTPGQWTHVSQTVTLNTPGQPDGAFTLDVNGTRVINVTGVYYREDPSNPSSGSDPTDGGLLGGILGGILDSLSTESGTPGPEYVVEPLETGAETSSLASDIAQAFAEDAESKKPKAKAAPPIGFTGIFFSTFFGGNTEDYATPTDQYSWFSDFSLTVNH